MYILIYLARCRKLRNVRMVLILTTSTLQRHGIFFNIGVSTPCLIISSSKRLI